MADANKDAERLAQLEAEVAALKAAQPKPQPSAADQEQARLKWIDEMHQMREARANVIPPWLVRETIGGVTDADARAIAATARAPTGRPGFVPDSQQPTSPRPSAGDGTGWVNPTPLGPPPGVAQADRLMDEADRRDRLELAERLARQKAMEQLAERKP